MKLIPFFIMLIFVSLASIYASGYASGCPSGWYQSGAYCAPASTNSKPIIPRPQGANCPSGWHQSGDWCQAN